MLKIKPNCEWCDKDLPPQDTSAMICSYECTFCDACVESVLHNVCPNCGGGFSYRPIRPQCSHREGVSLAHHPASKQRVNTPYSRQELQSFINKLEKLLPQNR